MVFPSRVGQLQLLGGRRVAQRVHDHNNHGRAHRTHRGRCQQSHATNRCRSRRLNIVFVAFFETFNRQQQQQQQHLKRFDNPNHCRRSLLLSTIDTDRDVPIHRAHLLLGQVLLQLELQPKQRAARSRRQQTLFH